MKFVMTRLPWMVLFALIVMLAPALALAQEEMQVVDEVIAQVNDEVITLSMLKREMKEQSEMLKQKGGMTDQQITDEINKHRDELIATLINERLLLQKGKELELTQKVEDEVNRRFLQIAKEQGIPSIDKLTQAMKENGLNYDDVRQTMRAEIMKSAVFETDVDYKIFWGATPAELQKYFKEHPEKFRKPESVKISEIFLSLAGRNEPDVKAKADQLVAQLRGGADFKAICVANSEREKGQERVAAKNNCEVGTFEVPNIREDIAAAIKNVKVGGVSDPLKTADGYQILRIDERTPGSDASEFNENKVREAITMERSPKAHDDYLQGLRNEAFIKVSDSYKAGVMPLLKIKEEVIVEKNGDESSIPLSKEKKGKSKFLKIFPKP